jgi:phage-related protein
MPADLFAPIFNTAFEGYSTCININNTIDAPGLMDIVYNVVKEFITKMFGTFAVDLAKISTALLELPDAISKALVGKFDLINDLINDYLLEPLNNFQEILSNTKQWIMNNFLTFWNMIKIPLPSIELNLGLFTITLPNNTAYNEMSNDSEYKNFNPDTIINFITGLLTSGIDMLISYVTDLIEPLTTIISLDLSNIKKAITTLTQYFANLLNPLLKILDSFIGGIIKIFNKNVDEVTETTNQIYDAILSAIPQGCIDLDNIPNELKIIVKFIYCLLKMLFGIIVSLFTFQFLT